MEDTEIILVGLDEICQTIKMGKKTLKELIMKENTPIKLQGKTYRVFKDDLVDWYRDYLKTL